MALNRSRGLPPSPKTIDEVGAAFDNENAMITFGMTRHKDHTGMPTPRQFFHTAYSCKEFGYVMFISENIVDAIKEHIDVANRRYLIDATFKVVPEGPYYQFLVIYIEYVQKVISIIFLCFSYFRFD